MPLDRRAWRLNYGSFSNIITGLSQETFEGKTKTKTKTWHVTDIADHDEETSNRSNKESGLETACF